MPSTRALLDRFLQKVCIGSEHDCWPWTGARDKTGYGRISSGGKRSAILYAHRVAWTTANGEIPDALHVLHRCDNRQCCNPNHLFLGTNDDNIADMIAKGRQASYWNLRLTEKDVVAIRSLHANGHSRSAIANQFSISPDYVGDLAARRRWRHI